MNNTSPSVTWGDELAPLEMQNTKGGDFLSAFLGIAAADFLWNLFKFNGDIEAAADQTGQDARSLWNAFKGLLQLAEL